MLSTLSLSDFFCRMGKPMVQVWRTIPEIESHFVGRLKGITVWEKYPFKIQVWIAPPNFNVPDHCHPNIDSIVVHLEGEIYLRVNGNDFITPEIIKRLELKGDSIDGKHFHIKPGMVHGFSTGPNGGVFMNIEKWTGKMTSAELDWVGEPINEIHAKRISAVLQENSRVV